MEWTASLDEYEKLVIRMDTPRVVIDNAVCATATLVKVDSARKHGILLEAVQVLTDLDLCINKAYISSDGRWFMDVFHVTDLNGNKLTDESVISYLEQSLATSNGPRPNGFNGLTALELTGTDRPGLLSVVFAVLADLQCNVVDAKVWTHNGRIASTIYVKDEDSGSAIEDAHKINRIEERLRNVLNGENDIRSAKTSVSLVPAAHTERRLHQMMFADRDYERKSAAAMAESSVPNVSIQDWSERGYSVVNVKCNDRPKLLFDIVCTLTDMEYVIFHATIDTDSTQAHQEFYIRHTDGSPISSEAERQRVIQCLQAAIERRESESSGFGSFVQVTVLEIYNEEIYDLLSSNNGGGLSLGWPKAGNSSKVRLEVMGKKAKNATFISGNEAGKISREVAKVEKRRIVKSTHCNERSSRSHCLIILDVPLVGGRLMLVDMAGSENIEQAGQTGFEAKLQTGKINQGNIALKRVVESIANGDSHVPFRDSKLTMLLQDSFEDDKSKILMILCASPDPKEMHKTISTLEYGAKAKCIVRGTHTPNAKDKISSEDSSSVLGSRLAAMDQFIFKLQMENKLKEKERNEAHKELLRKEKEVAELRARLERMEGKGSVVKDEDIDLKVNERTQALKFELEKKLRECQQMENEFAELGKRMEEKILQQQEEVEILRRRLEEIESELCHSRDESMEVLQDMGESNFMKRLSEIYADGDQGMEKSMDLDLAEQPTVLDVKEIDEDAHKAENGRNGSILSSRFWDSNERDDVGELNFAEKVCLSTVFEGEEEGEDAEEEEVEKEVVEEKAVDYGGTDDASRRTDINMHPFVSPLNLVQTPNSCSRDLGEADYRSRTEKSTSLRPMGELENSKDAASARRTRIQNIFMLCGNHRELSQHVRIPTPAKKRPEAAEVRSSPVMPSEELVPKTNSKEFSQLQTIRQPEFGSYNGFPSDRNVGNNITGSPISALLDPFASLRFADEPKSADTQLNRTPGSFETPQDSKENARPGDKEDTDGMVEVYVKWEASKEYPGKFITKLKVLNDSSLADLRKLIETHLGRDNSKQAFTFLMLGDPTGAPVTKENEATIQASKLPICNNHVSSHLACLRPIKKAIQRSDHLPLASLENRLLIASNSPSKAEGFSPKISQKFGSAPFLAGLPI